MKTTLFIAVATLSMGCDLIKKNPCEELADKVS